MPVLRAAELCDRFHLVGPQLAGDRVHLLIDTVLSDALRQGCQLMLDAAPMTPVPTIPIR